MAQYESEPGDGGSLAGSPANSSLTGDKLRRRPAHSRKASVESLDLENDTVLPVALERLHILSGTTGLSPSGASRPPRGQRGSPSGGASARESVASADEAVARDGSSGESSRAFSAEVTSAEKSRASRSGDKIRAIVASGGVLYDAPDGSRGYRGGDTRLVSIRRGIAFDALAALLDDDDASDEASVASVARRERRRVYYRDPNDGVTLLRVARDADIDEMFEEWDRRMATLASRRVGASGGPTATASERLKVYVVERPSGSASDSEPGGSMRNGAVPLGFANDAGARRTPRPRDDAATARPSRPNPSASASSGLQDVPSAELTLVHRLGGGAFGEVHLALWRGSEVAVKFLHAPRRVGRGGRRVVARGDVADGAAGPDLAEPSRTAMAAANETGATEADALGRALSADESDEDREEDALDAREAMASRESFLKEARVMAALHHPNVVFVYGVVDDGDRLGIVEEFMRSGSLRRLLNLHVREAKERAARGGGENAGPERKSAGKRHLSASVRARCALDVARGMAYLHSRRFVHFDLKCDNVLTARQLGVAGGVTCKVADFGLSKQQRGTACGGATRVGGDGDASGDGRREFTSGIASQRGTLPWTAPELFSDPASATERVDAYSFGVCMWELWTCDVPFKDMREQSVVWGIMTGKRPEVPEDADAGEPCPGWRDLMTALWREDPRARPTFEKVVAVLEDAVTKTKETRANDG